MAGSKNTGLKQMVEEAMTQEQAEQIPPVEVSGEAVRALSEKMRKWSGWKDSRLVFGQPAAGSPFASCDHNTRTFTANPETLVLNPNRVLLSVTPFRLRQEAVLTGCLLHEAGHARHSHWAPRNEEQAKAFRHGDGAQVKVQTMKFAQLLEEPRIEGLMARDADTIGAKGLDWTMRAAAAHLLPVTELSVDPDQALMDLISSWVLRAGRQYAISHHLNSGPGGSHPRYVLRNWVQDFTILLYTQVEKHLLAQGNDPDDVFEDSGTNARLVMDLMTEMILCTDDTGTTMIDTARDVLAILFPETDGDSEGAPMPGGGCTISMPGEGDSEDESEGEGSGQSEESEDGDESEGEGSGDGEPEDGESEDETDTTSALAQALSKVEEESDSSVADDAAEQQSTAPPKDTTSKGASAGGPGNKGGGWREPDKSEREIQKGAERFLRDLINPSEASKVSLTDTPSATVDGAALSAWKAGGQVNAPHFFRRTRREVEPSPPVKVAILVDVSGSMEVLQKPSAILSWALASAALDLRNFAGRGQQIESCMVHWGSSARVVQHNGEMLPGIREVACVEGTYAMDDALDLVEEEMPGFFDLSEKPANRLLVQFTDWELSTWRGGLERTQSRIHKALAAGVNMISVVPNDYSTRSSKLDQILSGCVGQRGESTLMRYNKKHPSQVWETAAKALR